ncbi:hypothetical protein PA598K_04828 [Paenibacillus sp. 598K]|uniref:hypothetical protein n=1 Tax=Paenibacillus sp. 598K TaxID=1117987 RepID=UPI000FF98778|nr:hypothetical protein [Paenibacillus sp. 598K]GBF76362.1 hypothetical protein PA598K_04828 [Paenibacillus sp. 598K]
MFDFRIMGVDLFPDVVGFILFALGFQALARESDHFERAKAMNIVLLLLSLFTIYEPPNTEEGVAVYPIGLIVGILTLGLLLIVVHHLLSGVKDIAGRQGRTDLVEEAGQKWTFFLTFQLATLLMLVLIFIPPLFILLGFALLIAAIVLVVVLMRFMWRCAGELEGQGPVDHWQP